MDNREAMTYIRDAILAINSYAAYEGVGFEDLYETPAESYDKEGLEQAEQVVDQIIPLIQQAERERWVSLGWKILPMLKGVQMRQKSEGVTWGTSLDAVIVELRQVLKGGADDTG